MTRRPVTTTAAALLLVLAAGCTMVAHLTHRPPIGVDLNRATRNQLADLPGVSQADAERIVEARPYHTKAELVERGIVQQATYARFADRVYVGHPS